MRLENRGGDTLASGAARCQFQPAGSKISQEKWDEIFNAYNAEEYRRNASTPKTGNGSIIPSEDQVCPI